MTVPNMTPEEFMNQDPQKLFLTLTAYIYDARRAGRLDEITAILDVFDADARRALLVGSSAMMAMAPGEYRTALESTLAKEFYETMNGGRKQ